MLRPTILGLLLACAASLSGAAVVLENTIPLLWAQTFEEIGGMPKMGETVNPDPWLYRHRMSFYRLLISATNPMMKSMGPQSTDNPIWGLPLQLSYTQNSGRLADPTGETTCGVQTEDPMCISPKSWWSCENYFTSVLPFLSAAQQGMFGDGIQVEMQKPAGNDEYCTTYTDCSARFPDAMTKWDAFFQNLKASSGLTQPVHERRDELLGLFWDAQMGSKYSAAMCQPKQNSYSNEESEFANSWMNSAEYVAAARFQFNFKNAAKFISPLPSRVLKEGDIAPNIGDLTAEENHTLSTFAWVKRINGVIGGTLVRLWKSAMCNESTRQKGQALLQQLLMDSNFPPSTFVSIMVEMSTTCFLS